LIGKKHKIYSLYFDFHTVVGNGKAIILGYLTHIVVIGILTVVRKMIHHANRLGSYVAVKGEKLTDGEIIDDAHMIYRLAVFLVGITVTIGAIKGDKIQFDLLFLKPLVDLGQGSACIVKQKEALSLGVLDQIYVRVLGAVTRGHRSYGIAENIDADKGLKNVKRKPIPQHIYGLCLGALKEFPQKIGRAVDGKSALGKDGTKARMPEIQLLGIEMVAVNVGDQHVGKTGHIKAVFKAVHICVRTEIHQKLAVYEKLGSGADASALLFPCLTADLAVAIYSGNTLRCGGPPILYLHR
jgi:hypothetical protein